MFIKIFGLYIAVGKHFGNCFSPAVVITPMEWAKMVTITVRPYFGAETTVYIRYWVTTLFKKVQRPSVWWHSTLIARKFGKRVELDHGTCYFYKGWLGAHQDV